MQPGAARSDQHRQERVPDRRHHLVLERGRPMKTRQTLTKLGLELLSFGLLAIGGASRRRPDRAPVPRRDRRRRSAPGAGHEAAAAPAAAARPRPLRRRPWRARRSAPPASRSARPKASSTTARTATTRTCRRRPRRLLVHVPRQEGDDRRAGRRRGRRHLRDERGRPRLAVRRALPRQDRHGRAAVRRHGHELRRSRRPPTTPRSTPASRSGPAGRELDGQGAPQGPGRRTPTRTAASARSASTTSAPT